MIPVLLCALAAYRLARLVALDSITDNARDAIWRRAYGGVPQDFAEDMPDDLIRRSRVWSWVYGLVSCPFCAGWWIALGTYAVWTDWWSTGRGVVTAVAVAGLCALAVRLDVGWHR